MKKYRIYVYSGDVKLGSIKYPLVGRPEDFPKQISVDWLIKQIDADFGNDNWTSFEYYKDLEETA